MGHRHLLAWAAGMLVLPTAVFSQTASSPQISTCCPCQGECVSPASTPNQKACVCEPAPGRFFAEAEYLLWWTRNGGSPPLVTTSPRGVTFPVAGVLGQQTTSVILGQEAFDNGALSGFRVGLGYGLDEEGLWRVGGRFFLLEQGGKNVTYTSDANGVPTLARPVFNPLLQQETATHVALENAFAGSINVTTKSEFYGFDANARYRCGESDGWSLTALGGFRYLSLSEELGIKQTTTILPLGILGFNGPAITAPNGVRIEDTFKTRNTFVGGQVGVEAGWAGERLQVDASARLGIGNTRRVADVSGRTYLLDGAGQAVNTTAGGLYALLTNSGQTVRDRFTLLPEFEAKVGFAVTDWATVTVGYTFLFWPGAARAGEQVDRVIDPRQLPTSLQFTPGAAATRPAAVGGASDFWAQGISAGVAIKF